MDYFLFNFSGVQFHYTMSLNIFWLIFGGIELAITHAVFAVILCCTIIGIPFGMQHFKLAKLALLPFGAQITDK